MKNEMNRINHQILENEKGTVLLWTMMFMALFFLTISSVAVITIAEIRQSTKIDSSTEAYLLADAGIERANNYASGDATNGKSTPPTGITGYIGNGTYIFKVVANGSPYDSPSGKCDSSYCYNSQATVGSIKRKIDGSKSDISLNQGKSIDLFYAQDSYAGNTWWSYGQSSVTIAGLLNLNSAPEVSPPTTFSIPSTASSLYIKAKITFPDAASKTAGDYYFGITDFSSSYPANGNILRTRVTHGFTNGIDTSKLELVYKDSSGAINLMTQTSSIVLTGLPASVFFELNYRKGGQGQNPSATLKALSADGTTCYGVTTAYMESSVLPLDSIDLTKANMYFYANSTTDRVATRITSGPYSGSILEKTPAKLGGIYISNIFTRWQ